MQIVFFVHMHNVRDEREAFVGPLYQNVCHIVFVLKSDLS